MCLSTITRIQKPNKKVITAYKLFDKRTGDLSFVFRNNYLRKGVWLKAIEQPVCSYDGNEYTAGFHAYTTKANAQVGYAKLFPLPIKIVKIKLRGVHTIGEQNDCTVLVAKELFIPKERKKAKKK